MRILFQGDSITDCGRDRNDIHDLGSGYPALVAKLLREEYPDTEFEFINKAISAEHTTDLRKRWKEDAIDLQPDIFTLLIGINDSWHRMYNKEWAPDEAYEDDYKYLLESVKTKTNAKIIVLEHYLMDFPELLPMRTDVERKIRIDRRLAWKYADDFIPLDGLFAKACIKAKPEDLTLEGVHPTPLGHKLIAGNLMISLRKIINNI